MCPRPRLEGCVTRSCVWVLNVEAVRARPIRGLISAALVVAAAGATALPGRAIVGGSPIQIAASPSTVYVEYGVGGNSYYRCTGSILDSSHVVTAAHCLYDLDSGDTEAQASQLMVDAGLSNFFTPTSSDVSQSVRVSSFRIHPGYVVGTGSDADDVAVLTLASPLDLSRPGVGAVTLPAANTPLPGGTTVTIAGFGRQIATSPASGPLASMTATTYSQGSCGEFTTNAAIAENNAVVSCTASPTGSVCNGDSGAGILTGGSMLVGVVTNGATGCPAGSPAIFTVVSAPEILAFIQGNDNPPTAPRAGRSTVYRLKWPQPLTVGATLTCSTAGWAAGVHTSFAFLNAKTKAVLQTGSRPTYLVPSKAKGTTIVCRVTASNGGGTELVNTISTSKIKPAPSRPKKH